MRVTNPNVRPSQSIAETIPQLQPACLRLSAMISQLGCWQILSSTEEILTFHYQYVQLNNMRSLQFHEALEKLNSCPQCLDSHAATSLGRTTRKGNASIPCQVRFSFAIFPSLVSRVDGFNPPRVCAYRSSTAPKEVFPCRGSVRPRLALKSVSLRLANAKSVVPRLRRKSLPPKRTRA